jgi:protein DJ-1
MSRGVTIVPDAAFSTLSPEKKESFDAVVIPGGAKVELNSNSVLSFYFLIICAETLSKDSEVQSLIQSYHKAGKIIGMICAGGDIRISCIPWKT